MKSVLATIIAAIVSLFGGHQIVANNASLTAASNAAVEQTADVQTASNFAAPQTTTDTPSAPATIIQQPVIERIVEMAVPQQSGGTVSPTTLATLLANLRSELLSRISSVPAQSGGGPAVPSYANTFGLSQRIDSLTNTAINTPTITSPAISGGSISGATVAGYLPLSGGTLTGTLAGTDLTLTGDLTVSGAQTLSGAITVPYVSATSTTVNSAFVRLTATNATTTNATSTSLFAALGHLTSGIIDTLTATAATITNLIATTITGTNLTATNATTTNATSTNAYVTNLAAANAMFTNATSTNLAISSIPWGLLSTDGLGNIVATSTPTAAAFIATSTTATSTLAGNVIMGIGSLNTILVGTTTLFSDSNADVGFLNDYTNGHTAWYFTNRNGTDSVLTAAAQHPGFYLNNFNNFTGLYLQKVASGSGDYLVAEMSSGASIFNVKSSGNVGIGTTTPGALLSANGNILGAGTLALTGTTGTTTIASGQGFTIGGSQLVVQQGSGNVGIGTTSPSQLLTVGNNNQFTVSPAGAVNVSGGATVMGGLSSKASSGSANTNWFPFTDDIIYARSAMKVANITSEAGTSLFNAGTSGSVEGRFFQDSAGTKGYWDTGTAGFNWLNQNRVTTNVNVAIQAVAGQTADLFQWQSSSGTVLGEIDKNGNVGIGTTTPWGKLSITGSGTGTGQAFVVADSSDSPKFVIQDNGNVGIGTTTPGALLSANGNILGAGTLALTGTTGTTTIAAGQGFTIGGSQFVLQQGSGNVGIGTIAPHTPFDVNGGNGNGSVWVTGGSGGADFITLERTAVSTWALGAGGGNFNVRDKGNLTIPFTIETSAPTASLYVKSNGSVGIGTTSPAGTFDVNGTFYLKGQQALSVDVNGDATLGNGFNSIALGKPLRTGSQNIISSGTLDLRATTAITFADTAGAVKLKVDTSTGNVGIGTANPQLKTHVYGVVSAPSLSSAGGLLRLDTSSTIGLDFGVDSSSPNAAWMQARWITGEGSYPLSLNPLGGNIGIGTTSPQQALEVKGFGRFSNSASTAGYSGIEFAKDGALQWQLLNNTGTNAFGLWEDGSTQRLTVLEGGNVGIGTATPGYGLDLIKSSGSLTFRLGSDTTNFLYADAGGVESHIYSNGARPFKLGSNGVTEQLVLASTGNVGIGTTTPGALLSANGNILGAGTLALTGTTGTTTIAAGQGFAIGGSQFVVQQGSGNVGIGTTSPQAKLDVSGGSIIVDSLQSFQSRNTVGAAVGLMSLGNGALLTSGNINIFGANAGSGSNGFEIGVKSQAFIYGGNTSDGSNRLGIFTGNGERMTITGAGNVGIGTTTPWGKLSITGSGTGTGQAFVVADSSDSPKFVIQDNGNVGIGTTSPSAVVAISNTSGNVLFLSGANGTRPYMTFDLGNPSGSNSTWKLGHGIGGYTNGFALVDADENKTIIDVDDSVAANALNIRSTNALGTIGIATTSPWGQLSVTARGSSTGYTFVAANSSNVPLFNIQDNGNVGIGTTTPWGKLSITGGGTGTGQAFVVADSANTPRFSVLDNGNVGIGTTSPSTALQVAGVVTPNADNTYTDGNSTYRWSAVYAANGTIQTSDARLKTNVADLNYGLTDILKLRAVSYTWTAHPEQGTKLGFIAQEVQPIMPEAVSVGDDAAHTLGLNYTEFIPAIVKAIQQLAQQLADLSNTVAQFAHSFVSENITATNTLCVKKSDGTPVCVTGDQLAAVLAAAGQQAASPASPSAATSSISIASSTPVLLTPPVIKINGNNPTIIHVGDAYADLGATITAPEADKNLGILTFLNGSKVNAIQLDTSTTSTSTIDYVVTDQFGTTATATRTVIVETVSP